MSIWINDFAFSAIARAFLETVLQMIRTMNKYGHVLNAMRTDAHMHTRKGTFLLSRLIWLYC